MPAKKIKLRHGSGVILEVKSIRLPNGNLLCPGRAEHDRKVFAWIEAAPGTSLFKRWSTVAVDEPDPR